VPTPQPPVGLATPQPPRRHPKVDTLGAPALEPPAAPPIALTPDEPHADKLTYQELHRQFRVPGSVDEFCDILRTQYGIDMSQDPLIRRAPAGSRLPGGTRAPQAPSAQPHPNTTEPISGRPPPVHPSPAAVRAPPETM
jgi:hypothetical protein